MILMVYDQCRINRQFKRFITPGPQQFEIFWGSDIMDNMFLFITFLNLLPPFFLHRGPKISRSVTVYYKVEILS